MLTKSCFSKWGCLGLLLILVAQIGVAQPAPAAYKLGPNSRAITYIIALTDRLRVAVFDQDGLSQIARVSSKGAVKLPLINQGSVVGLTIEENQDVVEAAYRDKRFLRNPHVTISVEEYAAREVIVQREVVSPGRVALPIESGMSVLDAITKAGGLTDLAKSQAVTVTRTLPDGSKDVKTVDVKNALALIGKKETTETDSSMLLMPDDSVYVPMNLF